MKIITFLTQKGGTAKTTSAANIGTALTRQGFKVLFVDFDQQSDLTDTIAPSAQINGTVLDVLHGDVSLQDAVINTPYGDIIPGDIELMSYEPDPDELYDAIRAAGSAANNYDFCIFDSSPELSARTVSCIYASDYIVITAQPAIYDTKAAKCFLNTVETIRQTAGRAGKVIGILVTRFRPREVLARQARDYLSAIAKQAGTEVFSTEIREGTAIKEAIATGTDIYTYAPRSNGAADYRAVTAELLERIHDNETQTAGKTKRGRKAK